MVESMFDGRSSVAGGGAGKMVKSEAESQIRHLSDSELVVSPQQLERYLAVERKRSFRALCWMSTIFLLVILAVSAFLLIMGIFVHRESQESLGVSQQMQEDMDNMLVDYEDKLDDVASHVKDIDASAQVISARLRVERAAYGRERWNLRKDLERFNDHFNKKHLELKKTTVRETGQIERLAKIEQAEKERQKRFEEIVRWYERSLAKAAVAAAGLNNGGTAATPVGSGVVSVVVDPTLSNRVDIAAVLPPQTILYENGSEYEGEVVNGKKHGRGTFTFANGDRYIGSFRDDLRHGWGIYIYRSGAHYEGEYRDGKRQGKGTYSYPNGDKFIGEYKNGVKNGAGVYIRADGSKLKGFWKDDQPVILEE